MIVEERLNFLKKCCAAIMKYICGLTLLNWNSKRQTARRIS